VKSALHGEEAEAKESKEKVQGKSKNAVVDADRNICQRLPTAKRQVFSYTTM
jgi:hypothetical protein